MVNWGPGVRPPAPAMMISRAGTGAQMRPCDAGEADGAEEFEGEPILPVLLGERFEIAAFGGARVVDEDVEAAELCERGDHDGLGGFGLA